MTPRHRTPSPRSAPRVLRGNVLRLLRSVPVHSWRDLRKPRLLAGLALIVALVAGGTGIAVAASQSSTPAGAAVGADRTAGDDRANRDYDRMTASPSPSVTESPSPSVAPTTPPPATTAPAPATTAPKAVPTTPKTATPKKTTAAPVPAGCSSYAGNQLTACQLLPSFGFSTSEMSALIPMWNKESSWNARAENPSSGAYGIPQALPGSKMASAGSDWQTNPATQIKWGLGYIRDVYGTPSDAWAFWQNNGWY